MQASPARFILHDRDSGRSSNSLRYDMQERSSAADPRGGFNRSGSTWQNTTIAATRPVRPYVLFVGEPEARKGVATLLQAMALLPQAMRAETDLVIAGASGQYPLPEAPSSVRVRSVGWVEDEELAQLYAGAAALAFPSRYEGFGLPVVEAMAAGAPVVAADSPGLREAGGQAALYVPAGDAPALAQALARVLSQPVLAASLAEQGVARARELTWDDTARRTLEVVEQAVKEARL